MEKVYGKKYSQQYCTKVERSSCIYSRHRSVVKTKDKVGGGWMMGVTSSTGAVRAGPCDSSDSSDRCYSS